MAPSASGKGARRCILKPRSFSFDFSTECYFGFCPPKFFSFRVSSQERFDSKPVVNRDIGSALSEVVFAALGAKDVAVFFLAFLVASYPKLSSRHYFWHIGIFAVLWTASYPKLSSRDYSWHVGTFAALWVAPYPKLSSRQHSWHIGIFLAL